MSRIRKYSVLIPFVFFLINVILRWVDIGVNSLAGDEPFSVYFAQMPLSDILRHLRPGNNPPLYELFLHFWEQWFGIEETAVRIPSLIFTGITAAFLYKIGNEFYSKTIGIFAALVFTFSNYATFFAHEARVYAFFGMLTCLSMYYFLRWLNDRYTTRTLVYFSVVNVLLLYAHYFGIMVLGVQFVLGVIYTFNTPNQLKKYGVSLLVSVVLFAPYIPVVWEQFFITKSEGTWLTAPQGWATAEYMLVKFANHRIVVYLLIAALVYAMVLFVRRGKRPDKNIVVALAWFFVPFVGMYFLSFKVPMFHDRYLMHTFVGFCLLAGLALGHLSRFKLIPWVAGGFVILTLIYTSHRNIDNGRHTKEAVTKVQELRDADTQVVMFPKYRIFGYAYYFNRERFKNYDAEFGYYQVLEGFKEENFYGINQYSEARIDSTVNKVIFMMTDGGPKEQLRTEFSQEFEETAKYHFPEITDVFVYKRKK